MPLGQSDVLAASDTVTSSTDGGGTGVPGNSVIQNITSIANAITRDVAATYQTVNSPVPQGGVGVNVSSGNLTVQGVIPLLLIGAAVYFVFFA